MQSDLVSCDSAFSLQEEFNVAFYKVGSNSLKEAGEMTAQLTKKRLIMSDSLTPGMAKEEREKSSDSFSKDFQICSSDL